MRLSAIDPVRISSDRRSVTFHLDDGRVVTQTISPSPKANLDKLAAALAALMSTPDTADPSGQDACSFGTLQWELDPGGDAIHRHVALSSPEEADKIVKLVNEAADEMNHHPHIARGGNEHPFLTITCTTHRPRGLTVRDTRLAHTINDILKHFPVSYAGPAAADAATNDGWRQHVETKRRELIAVNRQDIIQAVECARCGPAAA